MSRCQVYLAISAFLILIALAALFRAAWNYRSAWKRTAEEGARLRGKLADYPETRFYQEANANLPTPTPKRPRVIFLGDSIVEHWPLEATPSYELINRGIGKQTTAEMLVRLRPDVIDLNAVAVVILGGANDFNPEWGVLSLQAAEDNVASMVELATLHHSAVVVGTLPPVCARRLDPALPAQRMLGLHESFNLWLREYCRPGRCRLADFDLAMRDQSCEYLTDAVHPNKRGYAVMYKTTLDALQRALAERAVGSTSAPR